MTNAQSQHYILGCRYPGDFLIVVTDKYGMDHTIHESREEADREFIQSIEFARLRCWFISNISLIQIVGGWKAVVRSTWSQEAEAQ